MEEDWNTLTSRNLHASIMQSLGIDGAFYTKVAANQVQVTQNSSSRLFTATTAM